MIQLRTEYLLAGVGVATAVMRRAICVTRIVLKECIELLPVSFGKEHWFPAVIYIYMYIYMYFSKANISKLILFFLLLNSSELQDASLCAEKRVTHHVVCSDAFCEPEIMFNLMLSYFPLSSSLFKSICYHIFTYCFPTKGQYLLFHGWCYMLLYFFTTTRAPHYTNFYLTFFS